MNPLTINGLTAYQVALLDIMWGFEELQDIESWQKTLDPETQLQVDLLMRMVVLAATDDVMVEDTTQAQEYLQKFRL